MPLVANYTPDALTDRLWFLSPSGRAAQSWQKLVGEFLRDVPEQQEGARHGCEKC
jgi:hypothetical protein